VIVDPDITNIIPIGNRTTTYVPSSTNRYTTLKSTVALEGDFKNASTLKVTIEKRKSTTNVSETYDYYFNDLTERDENGKKTARLFKEVDGENGTFTTNDIYLSPGTTTTFLFEVTGSNNKKDTYTVVVFRGATDYEIVSPQLERGNVVTSNFVQIDIVADNASAVYFNKSQKAKETRFKDRNGHYIDGFSYEVSNLKKGQNTINFTVEIGSRNETGKIELYYADTPIQGSQLKAPLGNIKAFSDGVSLTFPTDTILYRNERDGINQFLSPKRQILLGIADPLDGRVDKYVHPAERDNQIGNPNKLTNTADRYLKEPTGRFHLASNLYWIDAGSISQDETDPNVIFEGSGTLPYDPIPFYSRNVEDIIVPSKRGTLTLKYDPNLREDAWKYVTVYHYHVYEDENGNRKRGWRNLGGMVNVSNNTISVPFDRFGYYAVMYMNKSFDDIISHYATNQLNVMYSKGIMLNSELNSFGTNEKITRGEFARMLVKIYDIPLDEKGIGTFADFARSYVLTDKVNDYRYIETAARAGIVRAGLGGSYFADETLTREEAAIMIARAANLRINNDRDRAITDLTRKFTDAARITSDPGAVQAVVNEGYFSGKLNPLDLSERRPKQTYSFDPSGKISR
ncbi:MAG: S-layer homology domain-containing protein, partial [Bacilli bacterium]